MNHAMLVGVIESAGDLNAKLDRMARRRLLAGEPIRKVDAANELANDVQQFAVAPHFMHGYDVRMAQLGRAAGFTQKEVLLLLVELPRAGDLDRHRAIQL